MSSKRLFASVLVSFLVLILAGQGFGAIIRVKSDSPTNGPGNDWDNAYHTVAAGLAAAVSGDDVWVAKGTYVERITLKEGAALYGGFAGTEDTRDMRSFSTNPTILDGNLGGPVVTCLSGATSTTRIDGFTIRNGSGTNGGGMYCTGSPTVTNNTITANVGYGIQCGASATVSDNTVMLNSGGGIWCVSSCSALNNRVISNGGDGLRCINSTGVITANTIESNAGRGIYCSGGTATMSGNKIRANGGYAIYTETGGTPRILGNTIRANGGGIYSSSSSVIIANNLISGNRIFDINEMGSAGIYCTGSGSPLICNNTLTGNSTYMGSTVFCGGSPTIANNIVAFNSSGLRCYGSAPVLRNNCVYNPGGTEYSGVSPGVGDIQVDPVLSALEYGQSRIQPGSPCIDAGYDTVVQAGWTDIDGQARIRDTHVDIGADELDTAPWTFTPTVVRVSLSGNDTNDGSSWSLAKRTVQAGAYAAAAQGGEVWVAAGTYSGRTILPTYAFLYGGFAGDETLRSQRDFGRNATILDGGGLGSVVESRSANTITASGIDGFTMRNGGSASTFGGVYCAASSPTIRNNTITANVGSGIYCYGSQAIIQSNVISANSAVVPFPDFSPAGGGLCLWNSNVSVLDNVITGNSATNGAGAYFRGSIALISGNTIVGNVASGNGGGVYSTIGQMSNMWNNTISANQASSGGGVYCDSTVTVAGNTITGNSATVSGGGVFCSSGPKLYNNTISGNSAGGEGGAVYGGTGALVNNIMAFNTPGLYRGVRGIWHGNCVYGNSAYDYKGISAGPDDILADPRFVNTAGGDYHLRSTSPCVNAGWASATGIPAMDMDGEARLNGVVDIGADEYWLGPARTVSDAKSALDASPVDIYGGVVSAVFGDSFYVEVDDRTSGMLVKKPGHTLQAGSRARVVGYPATNSDSERFIDASTADSTGTGSVAALGMPNRSVGGGSFQLQSGITGASGLNNIGLLVSTYGKVKEIEPVTEPAMPTWFTIDDGSEVNVKCIVPSGVTIDPAWQYVRVTGVSSCEKVGAELHAVVRVRGQADILGL